MTSEQLRQFLDRGRRIQEELDKLMIEIERAVDAERANIKSEGDSRPRLGPPHKSERFDWSRTQR